LKNRSQIIRLFQTIFSVSFLLTGCSMQPVPTTVESNTGLFQSSNIHTTSKNDTSLARQLIANGNWNDSGQIHKEIGPADSFRVKYHPSYSKNLWMVVEGVTEKGKKYPVILDTGASPALVVNDVHILENNFKIYPLTVRNDGSASSALRHFPDLRIGEITLLNWPCFYQAQHSKAQLFGSPITKNKTIIAGVPTLRIFSYIVFDSMHKEVEFSLDGIFEPKDLGFWAQYSFAIEEDFGGNSFLFVKIPVAGEEIELQLDTGSGRGLAISEELWSTLSQKIIKARLRKDTEFYPYIGQLPCKKAVIPKLRIGQRDIRNANISVFPDDSPLLDQCEGLLGMQHFTDTIMVLDFKRNLMWVKDYPIG